MAKRHKLEEIITKLRQVDMLVSQGSNVADAIRSIGVTEVTSYRWRQEHVDLKSDQVKQMKDLETDNSRLCKPIADLTLDKLILQEASRETSEYEPAGVVHRGEWVIPSEHVPANVNILHALTTTGRLPGFADGGVVGGIPPVSGGNVPSGGGDLHVHVYGGSGDDHIRGLVHQGVSSAIASNNRALPGMLADRQRKTG